ncbi:MAG: hypothetical protein KAR13_21520 [Desulfobulbaceae bacterium]|nr:hypothetical protein [Desulfobulbaceae bacterium]
MSIDIYWAQLSSPNGKDHYLETHLMGTAHSFNADVSHNRKGALQNVCHQPSVVIDVIYHLLYRRGKSIAKKELLRPHAQKWAPKNSPDTKLSDKSYNDNPADPATFSSYYVGITTDFWQRACQHAQKDKLQRMYLIYQSHQPIQSTANLENSTIKHLMGKRDIPTMDGVKLVNLNRSSEKIKRFEFLYLMFGVE